ncbi:MAG: hypothetical protein ABIN83_04790, partial [Sphingomicrobium sp.]
MTATQPRSEPLPPSFEEALAHPYREQIGRPSFDENEWSYGADEAEPASPGGRAVLGWALGLLAAAWLAFSAWSAGQALAARPLTSPELASWVAVAAGPLALLGLVWLMFGRTRRKEAEAFTRSVVAMRHEARSLEGLLGVLRQRIDENHSSLKVIGNQLMGLGDEAAQRLGSASQELEGSARRITAQGEALDRAADAARVDIGLLLEDLPRAEASARSMAQILQSAGATALGRSAEFETQVGALTERAREADETIVAASQRLAAQLGEVDSRSRAALAAIAETGAGSAATVDDLLGRSAEALDQIRSGIDAQAQAVSALVEQSRAGIGRTGIDAAEALGGKLASAQAALEGLGLRLSEQDAASRQLVTGLESGLAALDERFAALAADGDARAGAISGSLMRVRGELEEIASHSGGQESQMESLAGRMDGLRNSLDGLTADIQGQLTNALGDAELG